MALGELAAALDVPGAWHRARRGWPPCRARGSRCGLYHGGSSATRLVLAPRVGAAIPQLAGASLASAASGLAKVACGLGPRRRCAAWCGDRGVCVERLPGSAIDRGEAPPLLVERHVRIWASAWDNASHVVRTLVAAAVLPPLVRELEDKAANAHPSCNGARLHDFLRQLPSRLCLRVLVQASDFGVERIGAILAKEEGRVGEPLPDREQIAERQAAILVDAPSIDAAQRGDSLRARQLAMDCRDGVPRIVLLDDPHRVGNRGQGLREREPGVEAVVIPLVADNPKQYRRVIPQGLNLAWDCRNRRVAVDVHGV
mmetsp:Transcript_29993/g.86291  ORF Transcript_29993/g.86291 Transcript_29993/m.86291 type:complete len:314 (-) Transcript_29993:399-1340(-)